jgi:hypothetical protein
MLATKESRADTNTTGHSITLTYAAATFATVAQVHYVGTTSIAANRASAEQALTGITGLSGSALELPHVVKKAASANIRNSHDNIDSLVNSSSYTKKKTIVLTNGLVGQARILFDIKTSDAGHNAYGRIYRNGVGLGTLQSTASITFVTFSEDITQTWNPGDLCQIYLRASSSSTAYVQNFRLAYDDSPTVTVASSNTSP